MQGNTLILYGKRRFFSWIKKESKSLEEIKTIILPLQSVLSTPPKYNTKTHACAHTQNNLMKMEGGLCVGFLRPPKKVPQTQGLKTTETYGLTVSEAASWKSRCWQGHAPSKASSSYPKHSSVLGLSSYKGIVSHAGLRAYPSPGCPHLN